MKTSTFITKAGDCLLTSCQMDQTTLSTLVAAHLLEQYQLDLWLALSLRNRTEKAFFSQGGETGSGGGNLYIYKGQSVTRDNQKTTSMSALKLKGVITQSFSVLEVKSYKSKMIGGFLVKEGEPYFRRKAPN